jgi:hypothetical protein
MNRKDAKDAKEEGRRYVFLRWEGSNNSKDRLVD